jgi:hypothetical protein
VALAHRPQWVDGQCLWREQLWDVTKLGRHRQTFAGDKATTGKDWMGAAGQAWALASRG